MIAIRIVVKNGLSVQISAEGRPTRIFTTWTLGRLYEDGWSEETSYTLSSLVKFNLIAFFVPEYAMSDIENKLRALVAAECSTDQIRKFLDKSGIEYTDKDTLPSWEKQLNTEVFDMLECPDWAKYAAVDSEGFAFWYEDKPECLDHTWGVSAPGCRPIPGLFDSTNWENSLIQRPGQVKEISVEDLEKIFGCTVKIKKADSL